jgi:predicted phosphohydrolase
MRYIGDVHGKWIQYSQLISECDESIQVGDMGFGFGQPQKTVDHVIETMAKGNHKFIRGNHDNKTMCETLDSYIPDGTIVDDTMFIGGGLSIDQHTRTEGVSWWADEELKYSELIGLFDVYKEKKPKIMVTHDLPENVARNLFSFYRADFFSITRQGLDAMFEEHKPDYWIFGHWHKSINRNIFGTQFICLNELEYIDI